MRVVFTAVATMAALLACSDSVPTAGEPEAVLEHDVSLFVARGTDGDAYGEDAKRLLRASGDKNDVVPSLESDEEARTVVNTAAIEKLDTVSTVLASGMFGKATKQARDTAVQAAAAAADEMGTVTKILASGVYGKTTNEVKDAARLKALRQMASDFMRRSVKRTQKGAKGAGAELDAKQRAYMKKIIALFDELAAGLTGKETARAFKKVPGGTLKNTKEADDGGVLAGGVLRKNTEEADDGGVLAGGVLRKNTEEADDGGVVAGGVLRDSPAA
uniref:Uncharacterized protein n=1 Tax=Peronospora matthiolae TaxID=2874970 RepID=A0AAV1UR01_9STRA